MPAGSAAAQAGLEEGDLIQAVNGQPTKTIADLLAVAAKSGGVPLNLKVVRNQAVVELTVSPAAYVLTDFSKLPLPAASGRTVTANQKVNGNPLASLTDGKLGKGYGPVFDNGISNGAYKMDLGAVQPVSAITSWSYNMSRTHQIDKTERENSLSRKTACPSVYLLTALIAVCAVFTFADAKASRPNIVFVLCDDMGYGDVHCLNPERGKIPTPGVDRLAKEGMIFTDAHSGSSVCTPTRYGLLTGRYSWRTRLQKGVVQGFKPCLIAPGRPTVASFLKEQGYQTAIIGKWHLDFEYTDPVTGDTIKRAKGKKGKGKKGKALAPVGSKIPDGPISRGFDFYHGFHHAGDMKGVIENDTVIDHDETINMLPRLARKSVEYIDERAKEASGQPFFLYVPFSSPHTPIVPTKEWQGKSGLGAYADFVMQTDDAFKGILDALDRNGLTENTLLIFSSDNGCSKAAGIPKLQAQGHYPSARYRGSKADSWDGGHRVPFVVRWPGKVAPGSTSDQLICLTDFFATLSEITRTALPAGSAEESVSFLPALKGQPIVSTRKGVIHHSISGHFAYRQGKWKLLLARGSGGWTAPNEKAAAKQGAPVAQLYDMEKDPSETTNLYKTHPEVVEHLLAQMEADVTRGRSTDGPASKNDVKEVNLWKSGRK